MRLCSTIIIPLECANFLLISFMLAKILPYPPTSMCRKCHILVNTIYIIYRRKSQFWSSSVHVQWLFTPPTTIFRRLYQEITLPAGFTCNRCVLQLLRQAGEWAAPGGGYVFWSCADISIVDSPGRNVLTERVYKLSPYQHNIVEAVW